MDLQRLRAGQWKALVQLTINCGARFDLYDGLVRADQASPRVGSRVHADQRNDAHAGYARQFTPPPTELVTVDTIKETCEHDRRARLQRQRHADRQTRSSL